MTTILELAEKYFEDGKMVENINHKESDSDVENPMNEDNNEVVDEGSDDDVVEFENPNPIIPEPTIEISSDSENELEANDDANSVLQQNDEDMEYDSNPEEDIDDHEDQDFTP